MKRKSLAERGITPENLAASGVTPEMVAQFEAVNQSPDVQAVDQTFFDDARIALEAAGYSALEYLAANPGVSDIELTKWLRKLTNQPVCAMGLAMVIYDEAEKKGLLRESAKDQLLREILTAFPDGWFTGDEIGPLVKIGFWDSHVSNYTSDPRIVGYAMGIIRHLAVEHQPPKGWKPEPENDPLIDELFDRYWPVEVSDNSQE